jgi:hypothetical protein
LRAAQLPELSAEAKQILAAALAGTDAQKGVTMSVQPSHVQAGGKTILNGGDAEIVARFRSAIGDLRTNELIENTDGKGHVFRLTPKGFDTARQCSPGPALDDNDVLCHLLGWMKKRSSADNTSTIVFADVDRELNLPEGSAARLLETAASRLNYVKETRGTSTIVFREVSSENELPGFSNPGWNDPANPYRRRR